MAGVALHGLTVRRAPGSSISQILAAEIVSETQGGAGRAGEHAQEQRAFAPHRQGGRDPRLEDAITFDDPTQTGIQARPVERMGHLADESPDRLARKPRVRVQGDDVADVGGHGRRRQERGVLGAAQEPIELG